MSKLKRTLAGAGLLLATGPWAVAQDPVPVGYTAYKYQPAWGVPAVPTFMQPPANYPMPYPPQQYAPQQSMPQGMPYGMPPGMPQPGPQGVQQMSNLHGSHPSYAPAAAAPALSAAPATGGCDSCGKHGCGAHGPLLHGHLFNGSHIANLKAWMASLHAPRHPHGPVVIDNLPTHPVARSPRDFWMFYDNLEAERSRDLRPTLIP